MISSHIFRKYDIRGKASGSQIDITPDAARAIGHAFGTYVQRTAAISKVIVGRDNRLSSDAIAAAAVDGLAASGCAVIDIRVTSTPVVYWYTVQAGAAAGMMITGSHLAPDQNGFKLCIGGAQSLYGEQIMALYDLIRAGDFINGAGSQLVDAQANRAYLDDLAGRLIMPRRLRVMVDAGSGTGGLIAADLFEKWGHEVVACLYCEPDGHYPHHHPDPSKLENVRDLIAAVVRERADIGLAFDGDADRVGVVDDAGNLIAPDRVLALLAGDLLSRQPGARVVADISSSQVVFDEVRRLGGEPIMWMTGHSLVKAKMAETGALLAGEVSGHIFLGEHYFGFDDGYFAAGRLLRLLAAGDQPLSALDAALPRLYSTPVYRPHCPPAVMPAVLERAAAYFAGHEAVREVITIDGLRVQFADGWGGLRASNTEPVLSMRFEGRTEAEALAYRQMFIGVLGEFPQIDLKDMT
jgi:phosphomannomutase/phosphoglucomutase